MHAHLRDVSRWRNHRLWLLALESLGSLLWTIALAGSLIIAALGTAPGGDDRAGLGVAWGIAIAGIATLQLIVALTLERRYDPTILRTFLLAAPYPLVFWIVAAAAALRAQAIALLRGPRRQRVVWDLPRERIEAGAAQDPAPRKR
jgi:biofilm PGA synthesis N-glycosyltransferase PgaC